jgi:hypothetical protein
MKVVKLNRRFRQFKEHGHTVGLRFPSYTESAPYETATKKKLGDGGWQRHDLWYSYFGHGRVDGYRPYWITFRNEADATLVVLSTNLTKNR